MPEQHSEFRTPYEILGCAPDASEPELRAAYRAALRRAHPDTGGTSREFHAVQAAWQRVGSAPARAAYHRLAASTGDAAPAAAPQPASGRPRARRFGTPGEFATRRYLAESQRWAETAEGQTLAHTMGIVWAERHALNPSVVRHLPLRLREAFAHIVAARETAALLDGLGIGASVWHDARFGPGAGAGAGAGGDAGAGSGVRAGGGAADGPNETHRFDRADHVALTASGVYVLRSANWGGAVNLVRDEVRCDVLADSERPVAELAQTLRRFQRATGVAATAGVIVLPDAALPGVPALVTQHLAVPVVLVRAAALPQLMREGIGDGQLLGTTRQFALRQQLAQRLRVQ